MKERLENIVLTILAIIAVLLILISIYGLLTYQKDYRVVSDSGELLKKTSNSQDKLSLENADLSLESNVMHSSGDNLDIDAAIRKEMNRILDDTDFSYHDIQGSIAAYSGEHTATFKNITGIDFETFQLQVRLYKLDNPHLYTEQDNIPYPPVEIYDVYIGPLDKGQEIPICFVNEVNDYNYFQFLYGYTLLGESSNVKEN
nr:hypothetical protein [uncultured Butyricicoccus sp.]